MQNCVHVFTPCFGGSTTQYACTALKMTEQKHNTGRYLHRANKVVHFYRAVSRMSNWAVQYANSENTKDTNIGFISTFCAYS